MSQFIEKKKVGRGKLTTREALLCWEQIWRDQFQALRRGLFVTEGASGNAMLVKTMQAEGRSFEISRPGKKPSTLRLRPNADRSEVQDWCDRTQQKEQEFERSAKVEEGEPVYRQIPAEPHLFAALVDAKTPAQVRRICRRSKYWLKFRWDFPGDGFFEDFSACPRLLYEKAEEFCIAKLDPRYPVRDKRPSGDDRRMVYFARVMAGLSMLPRPYKPSYAVEVLRKMSKRCREQTIKNLWMIAGENG